MLCSIVSCVYCLGWMCWAYFSAVALWTWHSVEVKDISLTDYIQIRHAVWVPHTAGRYAKKQFKKAQMPIVERLVDRFVDYAFWFAMALFKRWNSLCYESCFFCPIGDRIL